MIESPEVVCPDAPPEAEALFGSGFALAQQYAHLLCSAGVEYGVIGPREGGVIWERHLINSALVAAAIPRRASVLDLGSGAGLPGIPLAIARPDIRMTLLEPLARRQRFLQLAVRDLGIRLALEARRAQETETRCDIVVARAIKRLPELIELGLPLLRPAGRLIALKGRAVSDEIASVKRRDIDLNVRTFTSGKYDATVVVIQRRRLS